MTATDPSVLFLRKGLSNLGLLMMPRQPVWCDVRRDKAGRRHPERDDLGSRRGIGRYQSRIDAAKSRNGVQLLLQRRDSQS
jgi:hypothetical protein